MHIYVCIYVYTLMHVYIRAYSRCLVKASERSDMCSCMYIHVLMYVYLVNMMYMYALLIYMRCMC